MTRTIDEVRHAIVSRLADALGCTPDEIDPEIPFAHVGLGSRDAVVLSGEMQDWLGQPLSPTVFYEYPTVSALAAHLLSGERPAPAHRGNFSAAGDPIAIIGLSCRFPGAPDAQHFWQLLDEGREAICPMPAERRALIGDDLLAPLPRHGLLAGYIDDVDAFDATFFDIGATEAEGMDPQHRLLLELSWHALAHAGQPADRLVGSHTGVFVGISTSDYALLRMRRPEPERVDAYFGTSISPSVAAGRIAYQFGFRGPALAVDTACSSSLTAVHLACQSLRRGESDLALAAGVNLILAPETTMWACSAKILSEDGRCRTFDRGANGYVRGEGGGVVVLKRLADAQRDGDAIIVVIRGSAANHDGRSSGLTAPNGIAQEQVIASALLDAGLAPTRVHYVEAHGTGTTLGDPIEVRALGAALCRGRDPSDPLIVASVKTNIGHLEAAAGIAGLIKSALALQAGRVPAHLHLRELNPHIAAEGLPIRIPELAEAWPAGDESLAAGVSAFGLSGTNVHLVLTRAPPAKAPPDPAGSGPHVLPISARGEPALRRRVLAVADWLERQTGSLAAVCYSAAVRETHHANRVAVYGESFEELRGGLLSWLAGQPHPTLASDAEVDGPTDGRLDAARLASAYVRGEDPGWRHAYPEPLAPVALPDYPFERRRHWLRSPPQSSSVGPTEPQEAAAIRSILDSAAPADRDALLENFLREALGRALQTPPDQVPVNAPLATLGLDSLMAIDLTNRLARALAVRVPPADLLESLTLSTLGSLVLDLRAAGRLASNAPEVAADSETEELIV